MSGCVVGGKRFPHQVLTPSVWQCKLRELGAMHGLTYSPPALPVDAKLNHKASNARVCARKLRHGVLELSATVDRPIDSLIAGKQTVVCCKPQRALIRERTRCEQPSADLPTPTICALA